MTLATLSQRLSIQSLNPTPKVKFQNEEAARGGQILGIEEYFRPESSN